MRVRRRTDLHPVAIFRIQEASGVFSFATVIFKKLSLYKANLSGSPAIQFWDSKMPKIALADCSGVTGRRSASSGREEARVLAD